MEIKIGVKDVAREVVIDSSESAEAVTALVTRALEEKSLLQLTDSKGNTTLVPGDSLAYVEIGAEAKRHIGFGPFSEA